MVYIPPTCQNTNMHNVWGYIHLCPSLQLASPGPMAGPRPFGRCLLSNGMRQRAKWRGVGTEPAGEALNKIHSTKQSGGGSKEGREARNKKS